MLGVISEDPILLERVSALAAAAGMPVTLATSASSAEQVLAGAGWSIRVIDLAASFLDASASCRFLMAPALRVSGKVPPAARRCSVSGTANRWQVLVVQGEPWAPRPSDVLRMVVCSRHDLERLTEELVGMLPRPPSLAEVSPAILGSSAAICRLRDQIRLVGKFSEVPVLVLGETGTGKELVARALHDQGGGPGRPFVPINCAAIPENLFEAELFGAEAGAFTGATRARPGLLDAAAGGTLFLDEIGEMPLPLQAKLLRVLETNEFRRVGAVRSSPFRARLVSATNRAVTAEAPGHLRPDLFFRLAGYTLSLPPLRERPEDVPQLATAFLNAFVARHRLGRRRFSPAALDRLRGYPWPGNVRELRALVGRCAIGSQPVIDAADLDLLLEAGPIAPMPTPVPALGYALPGLLPSPPPFALPTSLPTASGYALDPPLAPRAAPPHGAPSSAGLRDVERTLILRAWTSAGRNLSLAARELQIPRTTLRAKLRRFGAL